MMGRIVCHVRIPKVTGYLLSGILLSPSIIGIFSKSLSQNLYLSVSELRFISELALGLIAFSIGGEFQHERFKKIGSKILTVSFWETFFTFILVFLPLIIFFQNIRLSICLAVFAIATAPAATVLVLREYSSEGAVTDSLIILTGLNNFICLTLFTLCFPIINLAPEPSFTPFMSALFSSLANILLSLAVGFTLGFFLSFFENRITKPNELIVITMGTVILGIGLAHKLSVSPLLVNLVMGVTVINLAKRGSVLFEEVKRIDLPIYAAFFALSGANLHWELLSAVGGVGILYIVGRILGKVLGVAFGAAQAGASQNLKECGGLGLLAQAGVVLGLTLLVQDKDPQLGEIVSTTILSTVVVFEILGPLAVRWSIVRSGEVKIIKLIHREEGAPFRASLKEVIDRLRLSLGMPEWKTKEFTGDIMVEHVMRTHVEIIHDDTHFDQILKIIEHSRYNLFPVVNHKGEFTGMISFQDIRDVLYDGIMEDLIIAEDLVNTTTPSIDSKATINEALDMFEREKVDLLPVIDDKESKKLLGIVTQRDVLAVFKEKDKG
jgi:Kef-type K+ transport system membrane component KefB/CBS domain-containing protein